MYSTISSAVISIISAAALRHVGEGRVKWKEGRKANFNSAAVFATTTAATAAAAAAVHSNIPMYSHCTAANNFKQCS